MINENENQLPPIYVVSGGKGIAGDIMVQTALVQFPNNKIPVIIVPDIITLEKLIETIEKAKATHGIIVHTMVDTVMRKKLLELCRQNEVKEIDLIGELSDYISQLLGVEPIRVPGLYRKINQQYFDRIAAIEFTLAHDDGMNAHRIAEADIVLTGVSRVGKTPLSMYMAMFGWKVANVPLVEGIEPPPMLFEVDHRRVFGLTISLENLISHRNKRIERMGKGIPHYARPESVFREIEYAEKIFRKGGFTIIDVTNKPVESTANEIIQYIIQRFPHETQKPASL